MSNLQVIIGLGKTGLACVRYLKAKGLPVAVTDSRSNPPGLEELKKEFPDVEVVLGEFSSKLITKAQQLIVSPGVALTEPVIAEQITKGIPVLGDIELFAREAKAPIVGITGSNGKTTVTTLMGLMIKEAGHRVEVCGNIGTPVLDILNKKSPEFYVIELSSFQLETTYSLHTETSVVLNVSPDHMDRYHSYEDYVNAKRRIYRNCKHWILNRDEPEIWQSLKSENPVSFFTMQEPQEQEFGLRQENGEYFLAKGKTLLIPIKKLKLKGWHHLQNALACLAMGSAIQLPIKAMLEILQNFSGLPHRCERVSDKNGIYWYNDSKGTNVGATIAAILSLGKENKGRIILIAGGDSKKADLSSLRQPIAEYVSQVILLGQDAPLIENIIRDVVPVSFVQSMEEAVRKAQTLAQSGDTVLLSPACASWDMFQNYEHRGRVFVQAVEGL